MRDPGLDRHDWESEYQSIEEGLRDRPQEALPDFADLVERMLAERGIAGEARPGEAGEEQELVAEFVSARDVALRAERDEVDPGDVGAAVEGLQSVYRTLLAERRAP